MKILITGTPATGKTQVAKDLGKLTGWKVFHITDLAEDAQAVEARNQVEAEVDLEKLLAHVTPIFSEIDNLIFEGHLGCEIPAEADLVIVLRANPDVLRARMKKRGYAEEKIDENVMSELLDYCYQLSVKNYTCDIAELDTSKSTAEASAKRIYQYLRGETKKLDAVSWEEYLEQETGKPVED